MPAKPNFKEKYTFNPLPISDEDLGLLSLQRDEALISTCRKQSLHIKVLYLIMGLLFLGASSLVFFHGSIHGDRSLRLWSPANNVVRYKTVTFASYFFNRSPYLGIPAEEKDALWEELYDFGISGLSKSEASNLLNATLPAPNDPGRYVIQLEVFHLLHCTNMLRKAIYPDEYPDGWTYHDDGTVNHNSIMGLHWDHCIDALRQSIMCNADVTPVTFVHNEEGEYNIFPKLSATHTCRDFDKVAEWAKERQVKDWLGDEQSEHSEKLKLGE